MQQAFSIARDKNHVVLTCVPGGADYCQAPSDFIHVHSQAHVRDKLLALFCGAFPSSHRGCALRLLMHQSLSVPLTECRSWLEMAAWRSWPLSSARTGCFSFFLAGNVGHISRHPASMLPGPQALYSLQFKLLVPA